MADKKISELTAITAANTAADDVFAVVDTSSTETKKISRDELKTAVAQTGAEIKAAYEAEANAFTDAQFTKLNLIEDLADVTDTTNVTAAGALMDSEVTNLAQVKAFDSADYATAAQGTTADAALPRTGGAMTGAITTNSTFDGRDVAVDGAKLDLIDDGANNYVHPNHTGEVTSTADGATVIADNVVDEANLKVSNAPTNGYALTAQSGAAGGLTWAAVSGGSYSDSDVDTHLNTSTAATNEVLSWNGSDYDWVAQSGGGGGGSYELVSHTTTSSSTTSVVFDNLNDDYITYQLVMNWDLGSAQSNRPNIKVYDGATQITGMTVHRSTSGSQTNGTSESIIELVREFNSRYFSAVIDMWGIGLTNKPFQLLGHGYTSSTSNSICEVGAVAAPASGVTVDKIEILSTWSNIPAGANLTLYGRKSA